MVGSWLLIDAGNTRIKWALSEETLFSSGSPIPIVTRLDKELERIWGGLEKPLGVALSNVAGLEVEREILEFARRVWSLDVLIARSRSFEWGVTSGYLVPESLGVDRWLALVAARHRRDGYLVIVDAGSACTIDLLDPCGVHQGGYILPGLAAMEEALVRGAKQIFKAQSSGKGGLAPGKNTLDGVVGGSLLALVGAVERTIEQVEGVGSLKPELILTGGDAERLIPLLRYPCDFLPDLVLEGLRLEIMTSGASN